MRMINIKITELIKLVMLLLIRNITMCLENFDSKYFLQKTEKTESTHKMDNLIDPVN